jgi:hypothetical protein
MVRYFGKNRGRAISVSTLGGMIGVTILPLIVMKLSKNFGDQNVWVLSSLNMVIFITFMFLILHNHKINLLIY